MNKIILSVFLTASLFIMDYNYVHGASAKAINRHGIQLGKKKRYKKAVKEFDRAISIYDKASAQTYHNKGYVYEMTGNTAKAIECYEEAYRRNPKQIKSGEKLGFMFYKMADYDNAVRIGEIVIKNDPKNRAVPRWLPDAYTKKLQHSREKLDADRQRKLVEKKTKLEQDRLEAQRRAKETKIITATMDFMVRTGYYFSDEFGHEKGFTYMSTKTLGVNIPQNYHIDFEPIEAWKFSLDIGNPYYGALMPDVTKFNEKLEVRYYLGDFMLGIGGWFAHYKDPQTFTKNGVTVAKEVKESDFKVGLIFGYKDKKSEMDITFYPRLLPHDGKSSEAQNLDVDSLLIKYTYKMSSIFRYYSIMSAKDFYIFNHDMGVSNYYGVYELGIGVTLGAMSKTTNLRTFAFTIEFRERLYLQDLNNTNPYSLWPNGQGWLGMNKAKWLKGDPFSGMEAFGHVLSIKVEESIHEYFGLYQELIFEMGDLDKDHHEFNLRLGIYGTY